MGGTTVLLAFQTLVLAPPALAGVSCTPSNHVATVTASQPGAFVVEIERSGDFLTVNNSQCGKVAPIGDPDAIDHVDVGGDPAAFGQVIISLAGGPLGPGFTDEANSTSDEIEFDIDGGTTSVTVFGSAGPDKIVAGSHTTHEGPVIGVINDLNLNGFEDGIKTDIDVDIHGNPSVIPLFGAEGNDVLSGAGTFVLLGTTGPAFAPMRFNDGPGDDQVFGGSADDEMRIPDNVGHDTYVGGKGFDLLRYDDRNEPVNVSQDGDANDGMNCPGPSCENDNVGGDIERFVGTSGNDTFRGGDGRQFFDPGSGNDALFGGPGNDVMTGGFGADDFHGGQGTDAVSYADDFKVTVTMDSVADDGQGDEGDNVRADVETVFGSQGADVLIGNDGPNQLHGGEGNDTLRGLGGDDLLDGGGAPPRDTAVPDDGSDVFFGGPGVDTVTEAGHTGGVVVTFDNLPNDAVVSQSEGSDNVRTDVENVIGTALGDRIFGSPVANRLVGGGGNDRLSGAEGDDALVPGPGTDTLAGGPGVDLADYGDGAGPITANLNRGTAAGDGDDTLQTVERLIGTPKDDRLTGSDLPNRLTGGDGDDVLSGLGANDVLVGGDGDDTFNGGPGTDTCTQGPGSGPRIGCESS